MPRCRAVERRQQTRPAGYSLAAAGGLVWLPVFRRPRVGILATGDEILLPGDTAPPDGIFNSASFMLAALLGQNGADSIVLPVARDNATSLSNAFAHTRDLDMLITIGGASVGAYDLVRPTLEKAGLVQNFWKIAMRPGKPLMSGTLHGMPVLGLPGNPVAALVCSLVFVLPALHKLMGIAVADTMPTRPHSWVQMCPKMTNGRIFCAPHSRPRRKASLLLPRLGRRILHS